MYTTTFKNYEEFKKALVDYIHYYNHGTDKNKTQRKKLS
ncbi:IS3 family transposase [Lysinibacillus sp. NPDC047702]